MRPFASTISLDEARRHLVTGVRPISRTERLPVGDAAGRVAAEDITSTIDVPPFARSAMDGYAVVAADTAGASREHPRTLRLAERIFTGAPGLRTVTTGTCAEIATGAPMPLGADAVVMVEETETTGDDEIRCFAEVKPGQHVGRQAADIAAGATVVRGGDALTPGRIGALAAVGVTSILVYARPRVAILSTGNEIIEPGQPLAPGQIYDVNRFTLAALISTHGCVAEPHHAAEDTLDALHTALARAADADIIVFSGGSSVGARDLIVDLVHAQGEVIFHGIAVRPGKPTLFGRVGHAAFFGMPGNPTSCLSNAYILLLPFLRATARLPRHLPQTRRLPLARRIVSVAGRHQFYSVSIRDGAVHPAFKGSGDITSLSAADGYIEIPSDESVVEEGAMLEVTLF